MEAVRYCRRTIAMTDPLPDLIHENIVANNEYNAALATYVDRLLGKWYEHRWALCRRWFYIWSTSTYPTIGLALEGECKLPLDDRPIDTIENLAFILKRPEVL